MLETRFQCERCGVCCKHRGDLLLTPLDVFQMAKHLGITCEDFMKSYTFKNFTQNFPSICLRAKGNQKICIFYDKKKECTIYPVRPFACYMYPFHVKSLSVEYEITSFTKDNCGSKSYMENKIPITEWLSNSNSRYEEEKDIIISIFQKLSMFDEISRKESFSREKIEEITNMLYNIYDTEKDIKRQIEQRFSLAQMMYFLQT